MYVQDPASLKTFLHKEDIRELPSDEEVWEVPEPPRPDINLERGTEGTQSEFITALKAGQHNLWHNE